MTVGEVIRKTQSWVVVEQCGIEGTILLDTETGLFKDYLKIKNAVVQRIEPETDGGRRLLRLYVSE